ncbi:MAG: AMP-binding protein, partial [bacterium]|nr:AMP-binding protein [bacterium]
FEELVEKLSLKRDTGRNPLFDVMFNLLNTTTGKPENNPQAKHPVTENPGLTADQAPNTDTDTNTQYSFGDNISKFDLTLTCMQRERTAGEIDGENLEFQFEYSVKLFKEDTIKRFAANFKKVMQAVSTKSGGKIGDIEIITSEEKEKIIYQFNDTAAEYPQNKTIHRLFEEQAERTPDNIGLVGKPVGSRQSAVGNEKIKNKNEIKDNKEIKEQLLQITYRELNDKSNRMARLLMDKGTEPGTIVGIMVERTIEMIIGLLGILKAGCAYLPISPAYPQKRINYMLKDSNAGILLVNDKSEIRISKSETKHNGQNPNDQNQTEDPIVLNLEHLTFEYIEPEFVSEFGFRASD